MTAPVNPEGQTARERVLWRALRAARSYIDNQNCYPDVLAQVDHALKPDPDQPSEGQTAQEVRHLSRVPFTPWCGADEPNQRTTDSIAYSNCLACLRALASTPSPAKQTEQKIASAEGTASKSGAAPATVEVTVFSGVEGPCIAIGGYRVAGPKPWGGGKVLHHWKASVADLQKAVPLAPAQPDARDAELARLREAVEAENLGAKAEQGRLASENARLTKELEEARRDAKALREALAAKGAYLIKDAAELKREAKALDRRGETADAAFKYGAADYAKSIGKALRKLAAPAPPEPKAETPAETPQGECGAIGTRRVCIKPPGHGGFHVFEERPAPAETAGQKEGRLFVVALALSDLQRAVKEHGWTCATSEHHGEDAHMNVAGTSADANCPLCMDVADLVEAAPQDVAGTSGESLAGLSKEGSETP